jgi:hypothetical protein
VTTVDLQAQTVLGKGRCLIELGCEQRRPIGKSGARTSGKIAEGHLLCGCDCVWVR